MPLQDSTATTPEGPGTPDLTPKPPGSSSISNGIRVLPPTAPKGKPKAPPLIRGKIKPNESDDDISSVNGSKIPLLKTKHLETDIDIPSESRKHDYSSGNRSGKLVQVESKLIKPNMQVHRTVEKVRLAKGIEMRRVVQESNGIKTKRYNSIPTNTKAGTSTLTSTKESSQGSSNGTHRRKMTKIEASFPEVRSFTGHVQPTSSGSNLTTKSKSNEGINSVVPESIRKRSQEKLPEASSSKTTHDEMIVPSTEASKPEETPAVDFKTVDEFLKMPETSIPDTKARSPVKKTIYKSKFWEYIDPKNSSNSKRSTKETKKNYNPDAVKTFMQKQKEIRRIQQMQESKKKEEEFSKRQQMLKELDSKCQKIALKGKGRGSSEGLPTPVSNIDEVAKKPKLEIHLQSQSPSMKYLKPLLDRKQSSLLRKSDSYTRDVAKQSQYLLTEFENIVKRECISFLQKIPMPPTSQTNIGSPNTVQKMDKAVATSASLLELSLSSVDSERKQSQSGDLMEIESLEYDDSKNTNVPSPSTVEKAVTKIQAFYRGYKVREVFREAKIFFRKPIKKRCSEVLQHSATIQSNQTNPSRRWSFPKVPEKPYDNLSRLLPMSPIPMTGVSVSSNSSLPCYIPPPSATSGQAPRSPSRPRVLPPFPLTPNRVYNEPYPKQTRRSIEVLERVNANINLPSAVQTQDSCQYLHPRKSLNMQSSTLGLSNFQTTGSVQNSAPINVVPGEFDFAIPSSIPSIVDVLREKLRLLSNENNGLPMPNAATAARLTELQDKDGSKDRRETLKAKSSEDWRARKIIGKESGDINSTTCDDQTTPDHEDGVTPKVKKHKRRSRPRSQRSPIADSTTTVDTDADYVPSATRSSMTISERQKIANHLSSNASKSEETIRSSSVDNPTTTSSFDNFLAPALQLRYEAEREHLKIIEKALQVRLQCNVPTTASAESIRNNEQNQQSGTRETSSKKSSPDTDRVQLAIANCQKESMKAAAEMTKWLSEFQKTTREQERVQIQQTPVNLAATVIAAVEQARIIGIEKRKVKRLQEHLNREKPSEYERHRNLQTRMTSGSESQSSEVRSKVDKSVETSLTLVKNFKENLVEREQRRSSVDKAAVIRRLKDYQQQFPSESERGSPIPAVPPAAPTITAPVKEFFTTTSRQSSPEDIDMGSKFQEAIDYPSIIPSGNSVEFTSLDPRVSTLDYVSQISTEKEVSDKDLSENDNNDFIEDFSSMQKLSPQSSIADIESKQSASGAFNDGISLHSTIVDEAASSGQSNFIADVSSLPSKIEEVISEQSLPEETSLQSKINLELIQSKSKETSSIDSTIDDIESEQSKLISEVSRENAKEKTETGVADGNLSENDNNNMVEEFSNFSNKLSPQSSIAEIVSEKSGSGTFNAEISHHSTVVDEAGSSEHSKINADVSSVASKIEEVISEQSRVQDASMQSKVNVELVQSESREAVSIDSIIDDVSEQSKLISEVSQADVAEETVEKGVTDKDISENDHEVNEDFNSLQKLSPEPSLAENVSKRSGAEIFNDGISLHSTIVDEAASSGQSNFNTDVLSPPHSKIEEVVSEHTPAEDVPLESKLDLGVVQSEEISVSKTDDFVSEESKLINEVSQEDVEETVEKGVTDKDISENDHEVNEDFNSIQKLSPEPSIAENVSKKSGAEILDDEISLHSPIVDEAVSSGQSNFNTDISSSPSKIEEAVSEHSHEEDVSLLQQKTDIPVVQPENKETASIDSKIDDIVSEQSKLISEVSQEDTAEDILNSNNSTIEENASTHSKSVDAISERVEVEETSQQSMIQEVISDQSTEDTNEVSVKAEETLDTEDIDTNKRDTETEPPLPEDTLTKADFEIPLKPPPPYSPSSSLESTSLSSRSLIVSLPDDKLRKIAAKQADLIWDTWKSGGNEPDLFPDKSMILKALYDQSLVKVASETNDSNSNGNLQPAAEHNFDVLLCHLIYETMKEVLQVSNNFTSLIERVRPGPLSLHAQRLKIPKTKDSLVATVIARVMKIIPPAFFPESRVTERDKSKLRKWCSRPRELVDEILLEELVEEDYQWTEWWPEEVIISHHISTKIIQNLVRSALQKRRYVYSQ